MATDVTTKLLTAEEFMAADLGERDLRAGAWGGHRIAATDAGTWTCLRQRRVCSRKLTADRQVTAMPRQMIPPW